MTSIRKMRSFQILLFTITAFTFTNCMSDEFNLKNGVKTDITVGGDSLSFPLGKTKPILLSSMIKIDNNNDALKTAADGSYSLIIKDSTKKIVKAIDPVTFSINPYNIAPVNSVYFGNTTPPISNTGSSRNYSQQFILLNQTTELNKILSKSNRTGIRSAVTTNTLYYTIPEQTFNVNVNKVISSDVKSINSYTLNKPSRLIFKLVISNLHSGIESLYFSNYIIKLPPFLVFDDPLVDNTTNELKLNDVEITRANGYTKILTFKVIDFLRLNGSSIPLVNGKFTLNRQATMKGAAYIKNTSLTGSEVGSFLVQPSIVFDDMVVQQIDGEIKPAIDPTIHKVTLNLPDAIKQPGNILDIQNPVITLQVGNSMGFTVDAVLKMIPKNKGAIITQDTIPKINFTVPPAITLGQTKWYNYWISKSDTLISNYKSLVSKKLPLLFKIAPDEIEINVTSAVSGNRQLVDLYSQKNELKINYNVTIPFDFGENFSILYLDTIGDLKKSLKQVSKTKQVEMTAYVDNQIPLNLNFKIIPMDVSNKVIKGISVSTPDMIKACNSNGSTIKSTLFMVLKDSVPGSLTQLNALQLKVWATKTKAVAGMRLKAKQSVVVEMRVKIPKGLVITQN